MAHVHLPVQGRPEWTFISAVVERPGSSVGTAADVTAVALKAAINSSVALMFGEVGTATLDCDILRFDASRSEFWLRVKKTDVKKVWAALSSVTRLEQHPCALRVRKVSPHAALVVADSRSFTDNL